MATTQTLKDAITRAAVAWERARHEHLPQYATRDLKEQEDSLIGAVSAYNAALLKADAGEDPPPSDVPY